MYSNMLGILAKLENIIYNRYAYEKYEVIEMAKKIHRKILCNYKLTKKELEFINNL
jgi:hypothetical protein